jgi:putative phosphoesterase
MPEFARHPIPRPDSTMAIALIADTHGQLPAALWERLAGVERILHLGDLGPVALLAELGSIAPVSAIMGNVDPPGQPALPPSRRLELAGLAVLMRHEPWTAAELALAPAALFLHGHIHRPRLERVGRAWVCCPGALQRPRGGEPASYGLLEVEPQVLRISLHALDDGRALRREAWPRG